MASQAGAPLKRGLPPSHPGVMLKEIILPALAEAGTSRTQVATLLGVGRQTLYDILDGRSSVSPEMALRLAKLTGGAPEFWMNLQAAYDLWQARQRLSADLDAIPTLHVGEAA